MNEYRDSRASLIRFCRDFAEEMKAKSINLEVIDFDTAGEPQMWPKSDVIGIGEFTFTLDDGNIEVEVAIAVSTVEDKNNFRLADIMNHLVNKLIPGMRVKLLNASSGQTRGFLVVTNGTQVAPPFPTKTRTVQPIMVSLISDQTVRG